MIGCSALAVLKLLLVGTDKRRSVLTECVGLSRSVLDLRVVALSSCIVGPTSAPW
jgi:hypothetical protein